MEIHAKTKAVQARDAVIRDRQNSVIERMRNDRSSCFSTTATTGQITEGLACHVTQDKFSAVMDLGPGMGGDASGPSPSFFARAGIVGCVGIAIKMLAAREGLTFDSVTVTVETDFDNGALMGLVETSAAPIETRVMIDIATSEPEAKVAMLVNRALETDIWFLALRDAQRVVPTLTVGGQSTEQRAAA